ncbi:MAG: hypothetical protein HW400_815 [Candidatus Levybacteria bacterium]|nr:hypothetical protein [Candidatus Levybacteria bacterium]
MREIKPCFDCKPPPVPRPVYPGYEIAPEGNAKKPSPDRLIYQPDRIYPPYDPEMASVLKKLIGQEALRFPPNSRVRLP